MSKILFVLFLTTGLFLNSGCLNNVAGWDVSACVTGFDTCWELFLDNSDKFEDGFVAAIDGLGPKS